jgi:AcrR family transcriptional regulator
MTRNPNMREAILSAAELLFSTRGFNAVSIRDIALEAGANPGSVTYHFKSKDGLLLEIYKRHCGPMNKRRIELLVAARRVRDVQNRLEAIVRAYVQPAFISSSDLAGGGARFTRLRAVMSAEGNAVVGRIIAEIFDDTTNAFIEAIEQSLPHLPRTAIVWRSQFLLGALYYTLVNPERVTRLSRGEADGADMAQAIEQLVSATVASLQASDIDVPVTTEIGSRRATTRASNAVAARRKKLGRPRQVPSFCARLIKSRLKKRNSDGSNENRHCSIGASRRFRLARRWRDRAARQKRLSRQGRVPFVW